MLGRLRDIPEESEIHSSGTPHLALPGEDGSQLSDASVPEMSGLTSFPQRKATTEKCVRYLVPRPHCLLRRRSAYCGATQRQSHPKIKPGRDPVFHSQSLNFAVGACISLQAHRPKQVPSLEVDICNLKNLRPRTENRPNKSREPEKAARFYE